MNEPSANQRTPKPLADETSLLSRRQMRARLFKYATIAAVLTAACFLAFFLIDLSIKGLPALRQARIQTEVTFSPAMLNNISTAFVDEHEELISRAAKRTLRREALFAELHLPVTIIGSNGGGEIELEPVQITPADMPPWLRDFETATASVPILRTLIADDAIDEVRTKLRQRDLADTTTRVWIRGSDALQDFLTDSSGLAGEARRLAELMQKAEIIRDGFDHEQFGTSTTQTRWVLLDSEIDQYVKGYEYTRPENYPDSSNAPISVERAAYIDELVAQGTIELQFNDIFFLRGDSKIPEAAGMRAAIVGSVYVLALVLVICLPIGVMTSIYLEEFAPDNILTQTIEVNINNLAAIPSILFGVLGLAAFINVFEMPRSSVLVGSATLALMTLPVIIISSRAALRAVPDSIRRAGYAMGASRWQVVLHHVLPMAVPGIMTGSIIGLAQAMGETAPLIIIGLVSFVPDAPSTPTDPTTVMPAQIFHWWGMSLRAFQERAALGILVLLSVLFVLNALAVWIRARSERTW